MATEAQKQASKRYAQSEKGKATNKRYNQSEKGKAKDKKWREANPDKVKANRDKQNKTEEHKVAHAKWLENNPNYYTNYIKNRRKNDPAFRLRQRTYKWLYFGLKRVDGRKNTSALKVIGLESWDAFKQHIELQWVEGMTWDNYGNGKQQWSIDHIKPLSSGLTEQEIYALNHYTNLRPMWHIDNLKKGNKTS